MTAQDVNLSDARSRAWESERRELNHQGLKNSFLMHAERLVRAQRLRSTEVAREELALLRSLWAGLAPRLAEFVARCEPDCSPREVLADLLKGCALDPPVKSSLLEELHEEWCANRGVRAWVGEALESIDGIQRLMQAQDDMSNGAQLESACRRLCDVLQSHPLREGAI